MTGLTIILLLTVAVTVPTASAQGGLSNCCLKISTTKLRQHLDNNIRQHPTTSVQRLAYYYVQKPPTCNLHAVVFITKKGKTICGNPNDWRTKNMTAYLDERNLKRKNPLESPGT
ncbi:C-C motif chemokine 14-like [Kryptolebias marmoratus]|uniref:C-C motif chemokine 14-like n=1 Tax=Kryptolebias marmoratus TaxID=37003 RepID=UPI0007F8F5B9|nr:C-C motif chemokine 14-like [Kryptolebias marmoratus]